MGDTHFTHFFIIEKRELVVKMNALIKVVLLVLLMLLLLKYRVGGFIFLICDSFNFYQQNSLLFKFFQKFAQRISVITHFLISTWDRKQLVK